METEKAVTPKQLAENVEDFEVVLTVEASLADALNQRLDEQKVFTPKQLAGIEKDTRKQLFLQIVDQTELTWKQASYLLQNTLDCWKHTGEADKILDYPGFDTDETRKVVEILEKDEKVYSKLENQNLVEKSVAVVKEYQFSEVEKKVLPENYTSIDSFKSESFNLPLFNIFSSASEIVQSLKENIKDIEPSKTGIVLKPGTKYEPLVKSVLEAENIPFQRRSHAKEDEDVRTFLSLTETGLTNDKVRVKDVRSIIQQLGINISYKNQNKYLEDINQAREFKELLNTVEYLDFNEAVRKYHELTNRETRITKVIEELQLKDKQITSERINSIRYYLNSFEVDAEETREGVILADPTQVSQVDREHVFYLGMDTDWMKETSNKEWTNQRKQEEKHLKDFKSLIQSPNTYFMVQNQELNEEITPCFYLNQLTDKEFSTFSQLPSKKVRPEEKPEKQGFKKENYNTKLKSVETVSQSGLNKFVQSPRLYYMNKLTSDADKQSFEKGNLFHMYAEYHANNPKQAQKIPLNDIVKVMTDNIQKFADDIDLEDLKTEFQIGVKNIRRFLNQNLEKTKEINFNEECYTKTNDENVFIQKFPGTNHALQTEPYFKDKQLGAKGKIDLMLNKNHIIDYKSGRRYTTQKTFQKSHVKLFENEKFPDFQPLLYLTKHRKHVDGKIKFTFLHFLNELGNTVNGEEAQLETTITYHPETFQQKISSMEVFEHMIKNVAKSNDRRKTLEKLGYQQYQKFMQEKTIPEPFNKDKLLKTELAQEFEQYAKKEVGDYKYVEKGVKKTLKKLVDYRLENYFKEDADQMQKFLQEKLDEINEYLDSNFPVDANPDELPERDLILK